MTLEQIKEKVADALLHRTDPPCLNYGAQYHLWINETTRSIGCGWATTLRLQPWQKIVHTFRGDPRKGFTADEWDMIAEKFRPFFV